MIELHCFLYFFHHVMFFLLLIFICYSFQSLMKSTATIKQEKLEEIENNAYVSKVFEKYNPV